MTELLGVIGFILFLGTLLPFLLRRLRLWEEGAALFTRWHHSLALSSLAVLTMHGLFALSGRLHGGRNGYGHGGGGFFGGDVLTGLISWLVLLSVVALGVLAARKKPFPRTHCLVVGVLGIMVLWHIM